VSRFLAHGHVHAERQRRLFQLEVEVRGDVFRALAERGQTEGPRVDAGVQFRTLRPSLHTTTQIDLIRL
jgi:hypothetical protein